MAVGADVGLLQGVIFVEPFSVVLTFIFQPRTADFQQFAVRFGLGNTVAVSSVWIIQPRISVSLKES